MPSTKNWWEGEIDWTTPAGRVLEKFVASLPGGRAFRLTVFGPAPLQLSVDRHLLSADVDVFFDDDDDLTSFIVAAGLDKGHGGVHIESGFELSFRTSPRWRQRVRTVERGNVTLTIPHPLDILIGKLGRLEAKDLQAFKRVIGLSGHPAAEELKMELQNSVDLFRPAFEDELPNHYVENARRVWQAIFHEEIDVRREIIEPAMLRRNQGYGEAPPDYKSRLGEP